MSVDDCVKDLEVWNHLFVAGRLHKPHETVRACDAVTRGAGQRAAAQRRIAALLTLPESFTELEFHRAIVRLSYDGDVRFLFAAEDESKVERIARSNGEGLREASEDVVAASCFRRKRRERALNWRVVSRCESGDAARTRQDVAGHGDGDVEERTKVGCERGHKGRWRRAPAPPSTTTRKAKATRRARAFDKSCARARCGKPWLDCSARRR